MANLTKQEIIDELTKLVIAHDPNALKADLEALLPNTPTPESEPDVSRETEPTPDKYGVYDPSGHFHREYSREIHGDNFKELAEQFVSHPDRQGWTARPIE